MQARSRGRFPLTEKTEKGFELLLGFCRTVTDIGRWWGPGRRRMEGTYGGVPPYHARTPRRPLSDPEHDEESKKGRGRLERWRESLPTAAETLERLKSKSGGACNKSSRMGSEFGSHKTTDATSQKQHWQYLVDQARKILEMNKKRDGLMLTALTDSYGRKHSYLRVSLTERCNLRCTYCMPEEGVELTPSPELLTANEIERLVRLFANAGITKVRLTGGEPTLRKDLNDIVSKIAAVPGIQHVGITTNGIKLARILPQLRESGLSLLNISLDTLRPSRFEAMTRRKGHERVLECIDYAISLGYEPVKVNTVLMRGVNDDEIGDFVRLTKDKPVNVRFIEYMPFDGNFWSSDKMVPWREVARTVEDSVGIPGALNRQKDPAGEVAKNFSLPGHRGSVSFVTSMTSAFCGDCNRLRLMADGNFKVCLFGANEVSLRDAMRGGASEEDLLAVISAAVQKKKAAHAGMFTLARTKNRAMVKIGG